MADGVGSSEARYSAFISYSHADTAFARKLHRRLETYRLPRKLARRGMGGAASRRLKPIFRDRDELVAASDLTEAVREAIAGSDTLIVVCSPAAAASEWVDLEIRLFRELRGGHGVLAALYRGEPTEAMPPAMTEGGVGPGHAHQPLAADFRAHADGEHLALLKLIAVLAGVGLDQLVQRDAQRRVQRMAIIGGASVFGTVVAGVLAFAAIEGRIAAEHERTRSQHVVDYMLTDLRGKLKGVGRLDALDAVNQGAMGYYKGQDLTKLSVQSSIERAKLLQAVCQDDETKGDFEDGRKKSDDASRITSALYRAHSNNPNVIYAHAQSAYWDAFMSWRLGDNARALKGFKDYAALARRLPPIPNHDPDFVIEPANADSNLAMFVLRQSVDVRQARVLFRAAQKIYEDAGRAHPGNADDQIAIADGHAWLADTDRLSGDYTDAVVERELQRRTLEGLLAIHPTDSHALAGLVANRLAMARISAARGNLALAIRQLQGAHTIGMSLATADKTNKYIAKQVRAIELFEAKTWMAMPLRQRPSEQTIQAMIGDCNAERAKPHNAEITAFCMCLEAKALKISGNQTRAEQVRRLAVRGAAYAPHLSERWLIDMRNE